MVLKGMASDFCAIVHDHIISNWSKRCIDQRLFIQTEKSFPNPSAFQPKTELFRPQQRCKGPHQSPSEALRNCCQTNIFQHQAVACCLLNSNCKHSLYLSLLKLYMGAWTFHNISTWLYYPHFHPEPISGPQITSLPFLASTSQMMFFSLAQMLRIPASA